MIELKHLRTQSEAHYDLGNGQRRASIAANGAALHYFDHLQKGDTESPRWRKCDQTAKVVDGGWVVDWMPYTATAPQYADGVMVFEDQLSDGVKHKNRKISLWSDCQHVEGVADATSFGAPAIVYPDAFGKGSDLIYIFLRSGIGKWVRVRAGEIAQPAYNFQASLPNGATVKRLGEGGYELSKDSAKVLDKPRMTEITDGAEGATYFRPIRAWWGRGSCALPIEIENVGNDVWRITKSVPAEWDGTTDLFMDLTTTGTIITSDHYSDYKTTNGILSQANWDTTHDAATSAGFDAYGTSVIYVNAGWVDTTTDYMVCSRGRVAFTTALPGGSVITDGNVVVNKSADNGSSYAQSLVFVESTQASASALVAADFNNYGTTELTDRVAFTSGIANGLYTFPFTAAMLSFLPVSGVAKLALMSIADVLDAYPPDQMSGSMAMNFTSPNGGTIPVLNLTYTPPPVTGSSDLFMMMGVG